MIYYSGIVSWHLKSLATRIFNNMFRLPQIKTPKLIITGPLWGEPPVTVDSFHNPDSKVHRADMGPTWVLSDPDGPHVGPMNLTIREMASNADTVSMSWHHHDIASGADHIDPRIWYT